MCISKLILIMFKITLYCMGAKLGLSFRGMNID
jgi:hypothetical protein